jgi:HK97 family phage portal protein
MASIIDRLLGRDRETRSTTPVWPTRSDYTVGENQALTLTAVYRSIQIIATPISKMPLNSYRYATGIEVPIENPVLVNKPNYLDTRRNFLFETVVSLALDGNAFWLKSYGSNGQVNNLTLIPSNAVTIRTDTNGKVYYDYQVTDQNVVKTTTTDIQHLKLFPRAGYLRSLGPIDACNKDISAALDLRNYAANWYGQAGIPTGILKSDKPISSEDANEITERWHAKQSERKVAVLGQGFEWQTVQLNPKDAMFTDVQIQQVQAIARLFGVPARLLLTGVDGSSDTYSNLQDESQTFYRHTIMAYTDAIADALSECLPRGTRTEFNFEGLFKADMANRFNMWETAIRAGFMTTEEVRIKEGLA